MGEVEGPGRNITLVIAAGDKVREMGRSQRRLP